MHFLGSTLPTKISEKRKGRYIIHSSRVNIMLCSTGFYAAKMREVDVESVVKI